MVDTVHREPALDPPDHGAGAANARALPSVPSWMLIAAGSACAALLGRSVASGHVKYGVGILLALSYGPVVFFNFPLALAAWVAVQFFAQLSALSYGPNGMSVIVALGWLGAFLGRRAAVPLLRESRRRLVLVAALCGWVTLSIAWSPSRGAAATESSYWWIAALALVIVLTTITSPQNVRRIALAFVTGATVAVLIGLATGGLSAPDTLSQTAIYGRLTGGGGDPNQQAAGFIAALFLTVGLLRVYRSGIARRGLMLAFVVIAVGFFATGSRGGLIALAVATLASLVIAPRQRRQILALSVLVGLAALVLVLANPSSVSRITDFGGGTSGRSDLWRVGWQVFTTHPLVGVGIGNFVVVEPHTHLVLQPGLLTRVQYIAEHPEIVHNTYLQLLAETGVVGLVAFLAAVGSCLTAGVRAARRFDRIGRTDYGDLSRAVLMGAIGMLTALLFITDGTDLRLWLLLSLGPVLLGIAAKSEAAMRSR